MKAPYATPTYLRKHRRSMHIISNHIWKTRHRKVPHNDDGGEDTVEYHGNLSIFTLSSRILGKAKLNILQKHNIRHHKCTSYRIVRGWCIKWMTWWCISRIGSFNAHSLLLRTHNHLVMIMMVIIYMTYSFIYHYISILY